MIEHSNAQNAPIMFTSDAEIEQDRAKFKSFIKPVTRSCSERFKRKATFMLSASHALMMRNLVSFAKSHLLKIPRRKLKLNRNSPSHRSKLVKLKHSNVFNLVAISRIIQSVCANVVRASCLIAIISLSVRSTSAIVAPSTMSTKMDLS